MPGDSRKKHRTLYLITLALGVCFLVNDLLGVPAVRRALDMKPRSGSKLDWRSGDTRVVIRNEGLPSELPHSYAEVSFRDETLRLEGGEFRAYDFANDFYTSRMVDFTYGNIWSKDGGEGATPVFSKDITGDDTQEVIIVRYRRRTPVFHIISVEEQPVSIAQLEIHDSYVGPKDVDGDGVCELQTFEDGPLGKTFWKAVPKSIWGTVVIFKSEDDAYVPATPQFYPQYAKEMEDKVAKYPEALEHWRKDRPASSIKEAARDSYVRPPSELPHILLSYIYFGKGRRARELLDELWPPENPGKDIFLKEFDYELRHNTNYWKSADEATPPEERWPKVE